MTVMEKARVGLMPEEIKTVAEDEGVDPILLLEYVKEGKVVILANEKHKNFTPKGVGKGLRVKVNANIGTSPECAEIEKELMKLRVAEEAGADTVMDLSTGGDLDLIRREIIAHAKIPVGTVPIYQAAIYAAKKKGSIAKMDAELIFDFIERHASDGVDFVTVHCGVTMESVERLRRRGRITDIVSRGGAFLLEWMIVNGRENPLYERFERLLEIAKKYNLTLSLGDGLRPGSIADATDGPQIQELLILGELARQARQEGVQVMIEGPGHVPMDQIQANVQLEKRLSDEAPFYVLGPIVTDVAPGYDHITSAIGGAMAAFYGADFLCYVTACEHLGLPEPEDVREGVIVTRIAAHAADVARGNKGALKMDLEMSKFRKALDWEGQMRCAIDKEKVAAFRKGRGWEGDVCSMCGEYCALKIVKKCLGK